ncbi:MAG: cell division protein ZapA [Proteobacteria bacterium]|jgi:cell division protein ZapA|nr:cell division protein ZapA [Pseudomonadota bacterium]MDA1299895.1 cell division protein ZapA [Pseudomonadota bacterium]
MSQPTTVTVKILDKEYQVSCSPEEVAELRKSASFLDEKMRTTKESSRVLGLDRLAVMVALNITNDYLTEASLVETRDATRQSDLVALSGKLDRAISKLRRVI